MTLAARRGLPLSAQVLILVLASILLSQAMTIVAVLLAPPPRPAAYSLAEIAGALRGERVSTAKRNLLRHEASSLPDEFASPSPPWIAALSDRLADRLHAHPRDVRLHRRRPGGPPGLLDVSPPPRVPPPRPEPAPAAAPAGHPPFIAPDQVFGEFAAAWRQPDGRWLIVETEPQMDWLGRIAIWIGGGLLVMGPIGYWFARRITAPIRAFARAADQLGRDPQGPPLTLDGPAEVGVAARAFNAMQERIRRYVGDRVGMMGAISHDLRTPLTRIRFKIEKVAAPVRAGVLSDVEQMEQMIAAVLAFIRDQAEPGPRADLDLASLLAVAADDAAQTGGEVELGRDDPVIVNGDPVALQRLFGNLIDNALKYGRRARIDIWAEGDEAVATVVDEGPGLDPHELERVFAPFYRTEQARQGAAGGTGLGLAVARSIARAHGGEVVLSARSPGLAAEVRLPLA